MWQTKTIPCMVEQLMQGIKDQLTIDSPVRRPGSAARSSDSSLLCDSTGMPSRMTGAYHTLVSKVCFVLLHPTDTAWKAYGRHMHRDLHGCGLWEGKQS